MSNDNNDTQLLLQGDLDLYGFLDISPDASEREIRSQYRQKALLYHPDKQGGDPDKFNLLSKVYEILIDEGLRREYNEIRRIKKQKDVELEKLQASTRRFQQELKEAEKHHRFNNQDNLEELNNFVNKRKWATDLEKLKEDGLKRRRLQEKQILETTTTNEQPKSRQVYVPYDQLPPPKAYITTLESPSASEPQDGLIESPALLVRWKHKPELKSLFNADVLEQIMQQFGPLKSAQILPQTDRKPRYDTGIIVYQNKADSAKALAHNYKASANLWDGTSVRKLASLLRECTSANPVSEDSGASSEYTGNKSVDKVIHHFLKREATKI